MKVALIIVVTPMDPKENYQVMKFQPQKGKMSHRKCALRDSYLEPTDKKPPNFLICRKKNFPLNEKSPQKSIVRKSVQNIWGNGDTFFLWCLFGEFWILQHSVKRNSGLHQWGRKKKTNHDEDQKYRLDRRWRQQISRD